MFIVLLHYKKPIAEIDKYRPAHLDFLDKYYQQNYFVVSGRRASSTGGVIVANIKDEQQLKKILAEDPFAIHELADYEIIEFNPARYHPDFEKFI